MGGVPIPVTPYDPFLVRDLAAYALIAGLPFIDAREAPYNVRADGTDQSANLQMAVDDAKTLFPGGAKVLLPMGRITYATTLDMSKIGTVFTKGVVLVGDGMHGTELYYTGAGIGIDMSSTNRSGLIDLGIVASATGTVAILLCRLTAFPSCSHNSFARVRTDGQWSKAAVVMIAAEETVFAQSCLIQNTAGLTTLFVGDTNALAVTIPGGALSAVTSTIANWFVNSTFVSANSGGASVFRFSNVAATGVVSATIQASDIVYNGPGGYHCDGITYESSSVTQANGPLVVLANLIEVNGGDALVYKSLAGAAVFLAAGSFRDNLITQSPNIINTSGVVQLRGFRYDGNTVMTNVYATPVINFGGGVGAMLQWSRIDASSAGVSVNLGANLIVAGTHITARAITYDVTTAFHGVKRTIQSDNTTPFRYEDRYVAGADRSPVIILEPISVDLQAGRLAAGDKGTLIVGDGASFNPGFSQPAGYPGAPIPTPTPAIWTGVEWKPLGSAVPWTPPNSGTGAHVGAIAVDNNYVYFKCPDGNWRRCALAASHVNDGTF